MQLEKTELILSRSEKLVVNILKREFAARVQKNPKYSLRAFAQFLKIDQSHLTKIMGGKINLSDKMVLHLCSVLNIKPDILKNETYLRIEDPTFEIIGNWIHFALMELIKTKKFQSDYRWIAEKLNVHITEVELAVERLMEAGILSRGERGEFVLTQKNLEWNSDTKTSYAKKMLQKDLLKKAIDCVDTVEISARENSSLTIAIPMELIPKIKEEIQSFKIKIDKLSDTQENKTAVYQLCLALFPISKSTEDK
jgi:transcriptional regulator with XRE-family HTH domain